MTNTPAAHVVIPPELLPADGRFGCGPSLIRPEQLAALSQGQWADVLGTSHRQEPVRSLVGRLREGLIELFAAPPGYEVVLGNGGATALWDAFAAGLIRQRSQHVVAGEFGAKFAEAAIQAPFLDDPEVIHADLGRRAFPAARADVDVYAWPHNETSTGVMTPVIRPEGAQDDQLVVVDGTSAAGGILFDPRQTDVYYFSPQKNFGADGGIWFALMSPEALVRAEEMAGYGRWIPEFFSLTAAMKNSRANQTLNTPAIATLVLMNAQLDWINSNGGLDWAHSRTKAASRVLYEWAEARDEVWPFVIDEAARSQVVVTLDFADHIDAAALAQTLRANGIVDTEPYRKLGRNQLRIATFVSREVSDVVALTRCLDYLLDLM